MNRIWPGAALLLALVWAVAGRRVPDPEDAIEDARRILDARFAEWRGRVESAAREMRKLSVQTEPMALFEQAHTVLERTRVHGVAILDWKNKARTWAGRTFQVDPEFDLYQVKSGVEAVEVIEHPAHRVLLAAVPAGDEIAVAFFAFDETFPQPRDLGADVAAATGLASVRLRFGSRTVPLPDTVPDHVRKPHVIDELVHATFHAKTPARLELEAAERMWMRLKSVLLLAALVLVWRFWQRIRVGLRKRPLRRLTAATGMLVLGRVLLWLLDLPPWPYFGGTLWSAPGDIFLTAACLLAGALLLARLAKRRRSRHTAEGLAVAGLAVSFFAPKAYLAAVHLLARRDDDVMMFDSLRVLPGLGAAFLLVAVCLITVALFFVVLSAARWARKVKAGAEWLPYLAAAVGVWAWPGPLLAAGCLFAAAVLQRTATRPERAAALAFLTAFISAPILYSVQRAEFTSEVAERARELVDRTAWRKEAEDRLKSAATTAMDPSVGAHAAVADALGRGEEHAHLAFMLWAASGWNPTDPCAVQIWRLDGTLQSAFDFDSPPMRLLPKEPPTMQDEGLASPKGVGEGEAIYFYTYTFVLRTTVDQRPVGIARFLLPDHWDVLIANLRPSMFSSPLDVLGPATPRPLLLAEIGMDGKAVRTSDGTTADLKPLSEPILAEALKGSAAASIRYRDQPALMVLTRATQHKFAALVFRESLLQQGGLAFAKILLTNSIVCLLYVILLFFSRRQPVVFLFRHRVALFLALVSVAPVIMLAIYNKRIATQRYEAEIAERLQRRLDLAETLLRKETNEVDSKWCTGFAADYRMDINIYEGEQLVATSRPGIWDTGLMARRLAAGPYLALHIEDSTDMTGHEFFTRDSGLRASYHKVRREPDKRDLILAAPALEDRRGLERRAAESNALLLAIYLTTALVAVFVALYLARSLTQPVRELREATQRVAAGDLEATLTEGRADEFGDLVRAFNRMTREIRGTQELRVRVEKAAAWREMARQIAHEIKNPLTPIKLTVQNMLADYDENREAFLTDFEAGAKLILDQIEALQRIAGEFSAYARFPMRDEAPIDVRALVDEVAALFSAEAETTDEPLMIEGDRDELRRVLINLVTNSKQAGASKIRMRAARKEGRAVLSVHDDGDGISTMDIERIFDPNFTTKSAGTGLGMPIVKRVVDDHGGTITINSTPGRGTSVIIRLPLLKAEG